MFGYLVATYYKLTQSVHVLKFMIKKFKVTYRNYFKAKVYTAVSTWTHGVTYNVYHPESGARAEHLICRCIGRLRQALRAKPPSPFAAIEH